VDRGRAAGRGAMDGVFGQTFHVQRPFILGCKFV
jgi:hypothetical protein